MEKSEFLIDLILQEPQCSMISPGYKHPRTKDDMPIIGSEKIEWNPNNLIKLEHMVSSRMQAVCQNELKEVLEKKVPILYIDCSQKKEDDIMFYIFREYIKQSKATNKASIVAKAI
jgi:hypothetical protein